MKRTLIDLAKGLGVGLVGIGLLPFITVREITKRG